MTATLPYRRILVALDDSAPARHAIAWARAIASTSPCEVILVNVLEMPTPMAVHYAAISGASDMARVELAEREASRGLIDRAVASFHERPRVLTPMGDAAVEIARLARALMADLVVIGSHGRNLAGRIFLGSVADAVKNRVPCDVLIARTAPPPAHVLAAVDGSPQSLKAADVGERLANALGADCERYHSDVEAPATDIAARARSKPAGLIAMGSRGLSGVRSLVAGSVSNRVCHEASCSILLVKDVEP